MKNTHLRTRDDESWNEDRRAFDVTPYSSRNNVRRDAAELWHKRRHIEALPTGTYDVTTGKKAPEIASGRGLLTITVDAHKTMPVIAIDGTPITVGQGKAHVQLEPGTYCVEGQNTLTTDPAIVTISAGETTAIAYRDNRTFAPSYLGHYLKPPQFYNFAHIAIVLLVVSLVCVAPIGFAGHLSYDDDVTGPYLQWGAVVFIAGSLLFLGFASIYHRRTRPKIEQQQRDMAEPLRPYPWGSASTASNPILVGCQRLFLPTSDPSAGGLLLMFMNERHLFGLGPGPQLRATDLASTWVRPPRLWIDGVEQPASWGTWWYPLAPGEHRVEVEVNGEPSYSMQPVKNEGDASKRRTETVLIESRKVSPKIADSHTYVVKRGYHSVAYFQPRLWIEDPTWSNPLRDFSADYNAQEPVSQ